MSRANVGGRNAWIANPPESPPKWTRWLATDRNGTSTRPAGRQITNNTRNPSPPVSPSVAWLRERVLAPPTGQI
ncbi:hypothetical protein Vau01_064480 [Virgisporangium aurantiacum]|uniref:Uncharacterized protein n=1 Tax=Virgisporangium aurantiacum TaxID=175570 RepID=A0A8J4E4G9_9ACTN|nr:hypothetical protein Vau01_064480 [Virgisporangium aurantiacum]